MHPLALPDPVSILKDTLNKPSSAALSLGFWLALEWIFPIENFLLHWILLAFIIPTFALLALYVVLGGERRRELEKKAREKTPYVGDLLFLENKSVFESLAGWLYPYAVMFAFFTPFLIIISWAFGIAKLVSLF